MAILTRILTVVLCATVLTPCLAAPPVRIKDLTQVEGVRANQLTGYGIVFGLQGTGDGTQARFTTQSLSTMFDRLGLDVPASQIRVRNAASVMVTAELPAFARNGQRLDVQVASIGDAKNLQGGTLLMTPLTDSGGTIRAVAQGSVSIGGAFLGGGGGNSVQKNHPTAGRVPNGAIVEAPLEHELSSLDSFRLFLGQPDFATANRIADAINKDFGEPIAHAQDPNTVHLELPHDFEQDPVRLLARVEALEVRPDHAARVAINEKTGTVVMGADVRISRVALAHGSLMIEVRTDVEASQPGPFSDAGDTVVVEQKDVFATEGPNRVLTLDDGVSVGELVDALNQLGVSSRDMIAIFQTMQAMGALHAELVLM